VHRQLQPDLGDLKAAPRAEDVMEDDHRAPVHDPNPDRVAGPGRQAVGVGDGAGSQLIEVQVRIAELEQARAQLIFL
jgi:hypothetical protein